MMYFVLPLAMLLQTTEMPEAPMMDLHEALKSNKIQVSAISTGGYSGACMDLTITPTGWKGNVLVPAGTHFLSDQGHEQDIFVVEDQILAMNKGQRKFRVRGYCSQHNNSAPEEQSTFTVAKTNNAALKKLADYINTHKPSEDNFQEAVWAVSDRMGVSSIQASSEKDQALRKFVCELTGQKDVWYTREQEYSLNPDRTIAVQPVKINGEIKFQLKEPGSVKYVLYRGEEKLMDVGGDRVFDQPGEYTFQFNVSVKSWRKGDYYFKVFFGEKVMHEEVFQV